MAAGPLSAYWIAEAAIASTALIGYSTYQQGVTAKRQAASQAAWNEYNASIARREAEAERKASAFEAQQFRRKGKMLSARQRSLIGASGVELEGSPLLVMEDTAAQLALQEGNIRQGGIRRQMAYQSQSILDMYAASAARSRGRSAYQSSVLSAGSSLLSGASNTAYQYQILRGA